MAYRSVVFCVLLICWPVPSGPGVCHVREAENLKLVLLSVSEASGNQSPIVRISAAGSSHWNGHSRVYTYSYSRWKHEWQMKLRSYWKPRKKCVGCNVEPSSWNCLLIWKRFIAECYWALRLSYCCVLSTLVFLVAVVRNIIKSTCEGGAQGLLSMWQGVETNMRRVEVFLHLYAAMHGSYTAVFAILLYLFDQHLSLVLCCRIFTFLCWYLACEEAGLVWFRAIGFVCGCVAPLFPQRMMKPMKKFVSIKKGKAIRKRPAYAASSKKSWPKIIEWQRTHGNRPPRRSDTDPKENNLAKSLKRLLSSEAPDNSCIEFRATYNELRQKTLSTTTPQSKSDTAAHSAKRRRDMELNTPSCKRKRVESNRMESDASSPKTIEPPGEVAALTSASPAPQSCRKSPYPVGFDMEGLDIALTPASAAKLAQSCRKSPRPVMGSPDLEMLEVVADGLQSTATLEATCTPDELLAAASPDVNALVSHILRRVCFILKWVTSVHLLSLSLPFTHSGFDHRDRCVTPKVFCYCGPWTIVTAV